MLWLYLSSKAFCNKLVKIQSSEHKLPNFRRKTDKTNMGEVDEWYKNWNLREKNSAPRLTNFHFVGSCPLDHPFKKLALWQVFSKVLFSSNWIKADLNHGLLWIFHIFLLHFIYSLFIYIYSSSQALNIFHILQRHSSFLYTLSAIRWWTH